LNLKDNEDIGFSEEPSYEKIFIEDGRKIQLLVKDPETGE